MATTTAGVTTAIGRKEVLMCGNTRFLNGRLGVPYLNTTSVSVTDTQVVFTLEPSRYNFRTFMGGIYINVNDTFTAPGTAVPVLFKFSDMFGFHTVEVLDATGAAMTTDDFTGTGVRFMFLNGANDTIQIL